MSKINDLIKELCPDGVEYKKIIDVAEVGTGSSNRQDASEDGIYPFYVRSKDVFRINKYEYDEEAIIIPGEGGIGEIFHYVNGKYALHQRAYRIHLIDNRLTTKFLYYYMFSFFKDFIMSKAVNATVTSIRKPMIEQFSVPVPPLEVQEEIIRILDKFGGLEVELEVELEARKSQYEFWRGKLLENSKDKVKFGDIATIVRGSSPRPIQNFITTDDNGIPWIKIGDTNPNDKYVVATKEKITVDGSKKSRFVKAGDFILSNSMSFGRPYILKIDGCIHDGWLSISNFEDTYIPDFLYHLLSSKPIQDAMAMKASFGTVKNLNADIVKSIELPLYTKVEQEKIVKILDKFEELTNDISVGLPAEIELRRQQYEYYRNKLLSFEELSIN